MKNNLLCFFLGGSGGGLPASCSKILDILVLVDDKL